MVRICPNCKENLGSFDHYFCTSCGFILPIDIQQPDAKSVRIADFAREPKKLHELNPTFKAITQNIPELLNKKLFIMVGSALVLMLVFIGSFSRIQSILSLKNQEVAPTKSAMNATPPVMSDLFAVTELNLDLVAGNFATSLYPQYLPFNVEIVIEGYDLDTFGKFFASINSQLAPLTDLLNGKTDGHFVLFATKPIVIEAVPSKEPAQQQTQQADLQNKTESNDPSVTLQANPALDWSLLFYPKDITFNIPPEVIGANPNLVFVKSDPVFLITSQKLIADQVIDAKGKVAKSLAQTPTYIKAVPFLGGSNKLFILSKGALGAEFFTSYYEELKDSPDLEIIVKSILENPDRDYFLYK